MRASAQFKQLAQWLDWLETHHPEQDIELGLERVKSVAASMQLLHPAPFVITVAGTNGKGSTVAILESILLAAGYQVGVMTSPHFIKFNERVRINGQMADDASLCQAFAAIDNGRKTTWLTYFEFCTLVSLYCFAQHRLDGCYFGSGSGWAFGCQ